MEIKFGVLVGIVVWFAGTMVATGMVFWACYVMLFFVQMDLARLIGKRRRRRGWDSGRGDEIEVELEGLNSTIDVEDEGDGNREFL